MQRLGRRRIMSGYPGAHLVPVIDRLVREAAEAGIMMQTADDAEYLGRHVGIQGRALLNFGGCSYLGLEQRDELREAAISAIRRFGTQFSISRAYLQSPLYETLERSLDAMTGGYALVAPSTTLAHMAALPILVRPGDAVIIDQFTHASVHTAIGLLGAIPITKAAHGDMDRLEEDIARLSQSHDRVHYLIDGLYSMHGDFAPLSQVATLLATYPNLHLYVDDAHSTSWFGTHGRGFALERLPDLSRVVVALSLNKAFSAAGAALVFPSAEARALVRRCGGPLLFSGPIQPPMLAAAVASARLHLEPAFVDLQRRLADRIALVTSLANQLDVPLANDDPTPIFYAPCGTLERLFSLVQAMLARGFFVCPGGFPAVPLDGSGVRFTVSLHNTEADIRSLMEALADEMRAFASTTVAVERSLEPGATPASYLVPVISAIRGAARTPLPDKILETHSIVVDLGFDSLAILRLGLTLEEQFGHPISLDDWLSSQSDAAALTVGSLCNFLRLILEPQSQVG
jgi:7-keto-8-aminopelargonate synthetase-like enzyme/acyl carrier protein